MLEDINSLGGVVETVKLPEPQQKIHDGKPFPLILRPSDEKTFTDLPNTIKWLEDNRDKLKKILLKYGVIVFRDFPVKKAIDFDAFVKALDYRPFPYIGGAAPRTSVVGDVFTTNESPPDKLVDFHHEIAQSPKYPKNIFFFCEYPAKEGGQTSVAPSNLVYRKMLEKEPEFVKNLEEKGVRYLRVLPDGDDNESAIGRGWQSTYLSKTREEAESKAKELGTTFEWMPDGSVKTITAIMPGVRINPNNGLKMWHNAIINAYRAYVDSRNVPEKSVYLSDGTYMKPEVMDVLDDTLGECASDMDWKSGDVMMIDNLQVLHARREFVPPRRVLAWLCV